MKPQTMLPGKFFSEVCKALELGFQNEDEDTILAAIKELKRDLWLRNEYAEYVDSCLNLGLTVDMFEKFKRTTERHIEVLKSIEK